MNLKEFVELSYETRGEKKESLDLHGSALEQGSEPKHSNVSLKWEVKSYRPVFVVYSKTD